jgi:sugar O-acyltransferase (sialic acid O-acetyltransferase NeuD family)
MRSAEILLLGAGGHAESCIDVIEQAATFTVAGLLGMPSEVGRTVLSYSVVASDGELAAWIRRIPAALVAVGQIRSAGVRVRLFEAACAAGAVLPTIISPRAHVSRHASIGAGTIVMHGAIVNARAQIGENCIINSHALVEHGASVESHCHVSTGARLNSAVMVGEGSFIGSGAVVRQQVRIGRNAVVGLGQIIVHDVPDDTTVMVTRSW